MISFSAFLYPKANTHQQEDEGQNSKPLADVTNGETTLTAEVNCKPSSTEVKSEEAPLPTPTKLEGAFVTTSVDSEATSSSTTEVPAAPLPVEEATKDAEKATFIISPGDHELLTKYFGATLKDELVTFHEKILAKPTAKPAVFGSLLSEPISDRPLRGRLHQDVRRIFESRIETESIEDGKIKLSAAPPVKPHPEGHVRKENPRQQNSRGQPKGKLGWQELGGQFLHFSLYKENKDTMEVISYLCKMLKVKPKDFAFAGTKDRRAVTVQRVSVYRQHAKSLEQLNRSLRQARLGDFKHEKNRLELGELQGNQFIITLRDCHFGDDDSEFDDVARVKLANEVVGQAVEHLQVHGFINYFGLQRFGTYGIGTDEIGKKILKDDFEGAVWAILSFSPESLESAQHPERFAHDRIGRDDLDRAWAINSFKTTGRSHQALEKMPRKFSAESNIIRHLGFGQHRTDYAGAILTVNRNLRTMYVHAYQSLVWNVAASERWTRYGDKIIKGDLVLVDTPAERAAETRDEIDENGEVVIHPAADDSAFSHDDLFQRARALTAEEAKSGKYSIFDIVLPTPGFDIEYPSNDIGDFYKEFMASDRGGGLDPADMRRKIKDFSLSGSYRKLLAQVGKDLSFEIKNYHDENEQLVETDLENLQKSRGQDPRVENAPRNNENSRYNNGPQNNRGGYQNNGGGRGGRQNGSYNSRSNGRGQENDQRTRHNQPSFQDHPKFDPDNAARMSAWENLPAKLAAEDKAAAAAYEAQKLIPRNLDDIVQPEYKDTFIETSAENEGRRTGYRSTETIPGNKAKDVMKEESKVISELAAVAPDALEVDTKAHAFVTSAPTTVLAITDDPKDGGVRLISHESPAKRYVDETSTSPATEVSKSTLKAEVAVFEPEQPKPAKIAVIIKFALGTSQYATMALRELMKLGGVKTYKPDFSMGR